MKRRAFTLIEIMIVIIITGVLAGLALPRYQKSMDIHKASVAEEQLKLVARMVQMMVDSRTIPSCASGCDTAEINDNFDMDIHDSDFGYTATCSPGSGDWTVTATRLAGAFIYTLTITSGDPDTVECDPAAACTYIQKD